MLGHSPVSSMDRRGVAILWVVYHPCPERQITSKLWLVLVIIKTCYCHALYHALPSLLCEDHSTPTFRDASRGGDQRRPSNDGTHLRSRFHLDGQNLHSRCSL